MKSPSTLRVVLALFLLGTLLAGTWWFFENRDAWPRGEALGTALRPVIEGKDQDRALVAGAIWDNYRETRANASRWSGIYWGFTFTAAALSALAALILKLETLITSEAAKKDIAAVLSIIAALLITISTSGDFQRKWQANRIAAAELERTGYQFLEKNGADARTYLAAVGQSLLNRHLAIVGGTERKSPTETPTPATQDK